MKHLAPPPPVEEWDSVTAALAAKTERMKAAAAAIAKSVPKSISTYVPDDPTITNQGSTGKRDFIVMPPPSFHANASSNPQEAATPNNDPTCIGHETIEKPTEVPKAASTLKAEDYNALASLLDYSGDSSENESEGGDDMGHKPEDPSGVDEFDKELASFMEELESSGLLKDNEPDAAAQSSKDNSISNAASSGIATNSLVESATEEDRFKDTNNALQQSEDLQTSDGSVAATETSTEQRVLGYLLDSPNWCRVLDMGSRKIYYWDVQSNAVIWDPPPGIRADVYVSTETTHSDDMTVDASTKETSPDIVATVTGTPVPQSFASDVSGASEAAEQRMETTEQVAKSDRDMSPMKLEEATVSRAEVEQAIVDNRYSVPTETQAVRDPDAIRSSKMAAESYPSTSAPSIDLLLLQSPQPGVGSVVSALREELSQRASHILASIPPLVRLAVEVEVRHRDWVHLTSLQEDAVKRASPEHALNWNLYEHYIMQRLKSVFDELPTAMSHATLATTHMQQDGTVSIPGTSPEGKGVVPSKPADAKEEGELPGPTLTAPKLKASVLRHKRSKPAADAHIIDPYMSMSTSAPMDYYSWQSHAAAYQYPGSYVYAPGTYYSQAYYPTQPSPEPAAVPIYSSPPPEPPPVPIAPPPPVPPSELIMPLPPSSPVNPPLPPEDTQAATPPPPGVEEAEDGEVPALPKSPPPPPPDEHEDMVLEPSSPEPERKLPGTHDAGLVAAAYASLNSGNEQPVTSAACAALDYVNTYLSSVQYVDPSYMAYGINYDPAAANLYATPAQPTDSLAAPAAAVKKVEYVAPPVRNSPPPSVLPKAEAISEHVLEKASTPASSLTDGVSNVHKGGSSVGEGTDSAAAVAAVTAAAAISESSDVKKRAAPTKVGASKKLKSDKAVSALINKWVSVRHDIKAADDKAAKAGKGNKSHESDDSEEEGSPEGPELQRGVKQRHSKRAGAGQKEQQSYPKNSKTKPDLDMLSRGLPSGWRAMWDKSSGDIYYGNLLTKVGSPTMEVEVW